MSAPTSKMSHTQLLDSIIQKQKSKKTTLPFLHELLSLNDLNTRKAKAREHCSRFATLNPKYHHFKTDKNHILNLYHTTATNCVSSVFGEFYQSWDGFRERMTHLHWWGKRINCGIEILNAQPNATGSTYSNKCQITVKELKEACKANGIKATGDKKALLRALMKI
jgi:hypothetical protein